MPNKPSPGRKLLIGASTVLLTLVVIAILVEVAAHIIIVVSKTNFYLPVPDAETIEKFRTGETFSYELGWEPVYPNAHGYRGSSKEIENAAIALFGDSYTRGYPEIEKSWPHLLEDRLQQPVLNFGVGGYGTDQAYLRFLERYAGKLSTPYVALIIMPENIARVMNRYRGFYKRRPSSPKPMFYMDQPGDVKLLGNPIRTREEYALLGDRQFLSEIGQTDYWYQYYDGYGLNEVAQFPYSYYLIKALPYYLERAYQHRIANFHEYEKLYVDETAIGTLNYIIGKFIERAEEAESVPLVVFLPNWKDMVDYQSTGNTVYHDFYLELKKRYRQHVIDGLQFFITHLDGGAVVSDFFRSRLDGHYNPRGERVVAEGFHDFLLSLDEHHKLLDLRGLQK